MKRTIAIIIILISAFSLCACSKILGSNENNKIYGKVIELNDDEVTLEIGELKNLPQNQGGGPKNKDSGSADTSGKPEDIEPPGGQNSNSDTPPEKPDGQNSDSETPPEKPDSENGGDLNTPPDKPDGDMESPDDENRDDSNTPPSKPEEVSGANSSENSDEGSSPSENPPEGGSNNFVATGEEKTFNIASAKIFTQSGDQVSTSSVENIKKDSILALELNGEDEVVSATIIESTSMNTDSIEQGSAAATIDTDSEVKDKTYESTSEDENALRVKGAKVLLDNITVNKSAGEVSNREDGDFYGMNAALLVTDKAAATIKNSNISSSVSCGNGVFSYGEGTSVDIFDSKINTTGDNSGGIQTTGGATTKATNLEVQTGGNSSAAIRSDRGGGTVVVEGGNYTSNGFNSPAIYSTANITAKNAALIANNSESLVIEGKNSITLENSTVTGNMSDTKGTSSDENVHNVMIYQSMSGDSEVGTSEFSMTGGKLTSKNGDMIYVTNTDCKINLNNVDIKNEDTDAYLLRVVGNSAKRGWGRAGQNGGNVDFSAINQKLEGNIIVDSISKLDLKLSQNSTFTGSIKVTENEQNGEKVDENVKVTIEEGSSWTLTEDCIVSELNNNGTINYNGHTITLADGTVLSE